MKLFIAFASGALAAFIQAAIVGAVTMLGFQYLHHDVHSIPPLGFWACYFSSFAVMTIVNTCKSEDE